MLIQVKGHAFNNRNTHSSGLYGTFTVNGYTFKFEKSHTSNVIRLGIPKYGNYKIKGKIQTKPYTQYGTEQADFFIHAIDTTPNQLEQAIEYFRSKGAFQV